MCTRGHSSEQVPEFIMWTSYVLKFQNQQLGMFVKIFLLNLLEGRWSLQYGIALMCNTCYQPNDLRELLYFCEAPDSQCPQQRTQEAFEQCLKVLLVKNTSLTWILTFTSCRSGINTIYLKGILAISFIYLFIIQQRSIMPPLCVAQSSWSYTRFSEQSRQKALPF